MANVLNLRCLKVYGHLKTISAIALKTPLRHSCNAPLNFCACHVHRIVGHESIGGQSRRLGFVEKISSRISAPGLRHGDHQMRTTSYLVKSESGPQVKMYQPHRRQAQPLLSSLHSRSVMRSGLTRTRRLRVSSKALAGLLDSQRLTYMHCNNSSSTRALGRTYRLLARDPSAQLLEHNGLARQQPVPSTCWRKDQ